MSKGANPKNPSDRGSDFAGPPVLRVVGVADEAAAQLVVSQHVGLIRQFHHGARQQYNLSTVTQQVLRRDFPTCHLTYQNYDGQEIITVQPRTKSVAPTTTKVTVPERKHPLNYLILEFLYPFHKRLPVFFQIIGDVKDRDAYFIHVDPIASVYDGLVFLKGSGLPAQPSIPPGYYSNANFSTGSFDGFHSAVGFPGRYEYYWTSTAADTALPGTLALGQFYASRSGAARLTSPPPIGGTGEDPLSPTFSGSFPGWFYFNFPGDYQAPGAPNIVSYEWDDYYGPDREVYKFRGTHIERMKGIKANDPHEMRVHAEFRTGKFKDDALGVRSDYRDQTTVDGPDPDNEVFDRTNSTGFVEAPITETSRQLVEDEVNSVSTVVIDLVKYRVRYGNVVKLQFSMFQAAAVNQLVKFLPPFGTPQVGGPDEDEDVPQFADSVLVAHEDFDVDAWYDRPIPVGPGDCELVVTRTNKIGEYGPDASGNLTVPINAPETLDDLLYAGYGFDPGYKNPTYEDRKSLHTKTITDRQTEQGNALSPPSNPPWGELFGTLTYYLDENILDFKPDE